MRARLKIRANRGADFPCGHRVQTSPNGFVRARTTLYNAMINGGHQFVVTGFWANDKAIKQCNGTYVGSDGFVTYIDI